MTIISNVQFSSDIIYDGGKLMTVFLIIVLIISLLLTDTKYWDKYISNMLDISSNPLLLIFVVIVIFKIMLII